MAEVSGFPGITALPQWYRNDQPFPRHLLLRVIFYLTEYVYCSHLGNTL